MCLFRQQPLLGAIGMFQDRKMCALTPIWGGAEASLQFILQAVDLKEQDGLRYRSTSAVSE